MIPVQFKNTIMSGIVIYQSKYGATRDYAGWISDEIQLPVVDIHQIKKEVIETADFFVIGSSVYIGKLLIKNWLKKNEDWLQRKKIFLFVVCGTPANEMKKLESYINTSVSAELKDKCDIYFLPAKMCVQKLSFFDRFMLKMGARLAKDKKVSRQMLTDYNAVRNENLLPILSAIVKFNSNKIRTKAMQAV